MRSVQIQCRVAPAFKTALFDLAEREMTPDEIALGASPNVSRVIRRALAAELARCSETQSNTVSYDVIHPPPDPPLTCGRAYPPTSPPTTAIEDEDRRSETRAQARQSSAEPAGRVARGDGRETRTPSKRAVALLEEATTEELGAVQRIVRQYMLLQTTVAWIAKRGRIKASGPSVQLEGAVLEAWREYPYMDMWTEGLEKWASHDERDGAIADQKVFSLWRLIDRPKRQRGREERDFTKHRFIASFAGYEGVNDYADWRVEGADDADVVRREMVSAAAQEVSAEQPAPDADGWVKNRARIRLLRVGIEHLEGGVMDEESRARLARFRAELATREALADDGAQEGRGAGEVAAISRDEAARVASAP